MSSERVVNDEERTTDLPMRRTLDPAGATALETRLKAQAFGLGFDLAGIATLGPADTAPEFDAWLAHGYAGEMRYLTGTGAALRRDSRRPEPGMQSAIVVALNYGGTQPSGPIARYARGDDYHHVMRDKLRLLGKWLLRETGADVRARPYVDTGPILERDLARRAGLGWNSGPRPPIFRLWNDATSRRSAETAERRTKWQRRYQCQ